MATAGRMTLVKAVVTAVAIYRLTMLDLSVEVLRKIDRLRHAYLWAGSQGDRWVVQNQLGSCVQTKGVCRPGNCQP